MEQRQILALRRQVQAQGEWLEVLATPAFKRWLWFVPLGWKPYTVGRWYPEPRWLQRLRGVA